MPVIDRNQANILRSSGSFKAKIVDDGYGNLFDVAGVEDDYILPTWVDDGNYFNNLTPNGSIVHVGNVFYAHGILTITNPDYLYLFPLDCEDPLTLIIKEALEFEKNSLIDNDGESYSSFAEFIDRLLDKGAVLPGCEVCETTCDKYVFASVETYLKYAEAVGLTGGAAVPGDGGPLPVVTSFTPTNGTAGTIITITGQNFTGTVSVKIGDVIYTSSAFTVINSTTIQLIVSAEGTSGKISVNTPSGVGTSSDNFIFNGVSVPDGPVGGDCCMKIAASLETFKKASEAVGGQDAFSIIKIYDPNSSISSVGPMDLVYDCDCCCSEEGDGDFVNCYNNLISYFAYKVGANSMSNLWDKGVIETSTMNGVSLLCALQNAYLTVFGNSITAEGLLAVWNRILDKGIIVDNTYPCRTVIASVETYLKYAEAVGLTQSAAVP